MYFLSEILSQPTPDKRAEVICHLIRVAQELFHGIMNFDGLMIIMQALEATCVYRYESDHIYAHIFTYVWVTLDLN